MLMSIKLRTNYTNNKNNTNNKNSTNSTNNIKDSIREIKIIRRVGWVELGISWVEGILCKCNGNMRLIMKELMCNDYLYVVCIL